jgi:hypothetical protein
MSSLVRASEEQVIRTVSTEKSAEGLRKPLSRSGGGIFPEQTQNDTGSRALKSSTAYNIARFGLVYNLTLPHKDWGSSGNKPVLISQVHF